MTFRQLHKLLSYLIAGLGLVGLTLGGELQGPSLVVVFLAYAGSALCEEPLISRPGWTRGWNAIVLAALAVQLLRGLMGASILSLGVEYAALLQLSRLFNRRGAAEHQQIAVLALLHLVATTVLTREIGYAFVFVGFVLTTPWMLAMSQLRTEFEKDGFETTPGAASIASKAGHAPASSAKARRFLASRDLVTPRFFVATGALTVPIFAATLVLFLLFPRVGLGFLPTGRTSGSATTGFGKEVELGNFGTIRTDPTVALRFWPELGRQKARVALPLRFRGTSFDGYDGRKWSRSVLSREKVSHFGHFFALTRTGRSDDLQIRIELEGLAEPVLFLPDHTVALEVPPLFRRSGRVMRSLSRGAGLDVRYEDGLDGIHYIAHVSEDDAAVPDRLPSTRDLRRYLALPDRYGPGSRIARLAQRLTGDAVSPVRKARRIQAWLQEPTRFRYSLTLPDVGNEDPLEVFLFRARSGHCEYFSTALAILLRTSGVPTRNVTGFLGGEYNPYGDYYVIRQGDAHSWVELYDGERWVMFDPTPPANGAAGASWAEPLFREARAIYDAVLSRWQRHVVNYNLSQQVGLLRAATSWLRGGSRSWLPDQDEGERSDAPTGLGAAAGALGALLLAALGIVLLRARRKRSRGRPRHGAEALYQTLDRRLKRLGKGRPPSRTPLEHAHALEAEQFFAAPVVSAVTERYLAARFGAEALKPGEFQQWTKEIERVRSQ